MRVILGLSLVFLLSGSSLAQDELSVLKRVFPTAYPPAARALLAVGEVSVYAVVNGQGEVESARAFRGHPLLRAASESAAKNWVFSRSEGPRELIDVVLTFDFSIGGIRFIERSEKDCEASVVGNFSSAFSATVVYEELIPRLLMLPRVRGEIEPKYCEIHRELMAVEAQSVDCETSDSRPHFERTPEFNEAEDEGFDNANVEEAYGCRNDGVERAEIRFCNACRAARANWLVLNK